MPSTFLSQVRACAALALIDSAVRAQGLPVLSCSDAPDEPAALRQAPQGATRTQPHVLEVTTANGVLRFIDKPRQDGLDLVGRQWRYCAYNAQAQVHLIQVSNDRVRSGDLVLAATGRLLRAGHTVLFAPDRKTYLAIEHEDGGETWTVYGADGRPRWKGPAGTAAGVPAKFDRPTWTAGGELTARFVCASSGATGIVRFGKSPSGGWTWRDPPRC